MAKFYFSQFAAKPLTYSGRVFRFEVCSLLAGRPVGTYRAEDEEEIKILDGVVASRRGVKEIDEAEYETLQKKKKQTPPPSNSGVSKARVVQPPILPQMAVEAKAGVPSAGLRADGSQNPPENLPPSPTIGSLVRTQRVNSPKPFASAEQKTKKAADRGKIRVARKAEKAAVK